MSAGSADRAPSAVTLQSNLFVAAHMDGAIELGRRLADLVGESDAFVEALTGGLADLADPVYEIGLRSVTPGLGSVVGVRLPLLEATHKALRRATKQTPPGLMLVLTDRLLSHDAIDVRWFGMWNLESLLAADPEATWRLMRRAAAEAGEWISVDTLAHPYGAGILLDGARWAELGRLISSPSRWERRLVGSTLATLPHVKLAGRADAIVAVNGLDLIGRLIGDAEPDVQKALSWALRSLAAIDAPAVVAFAEDQTRIARATEDGHRAWVIRDSLTKLPGGSQKTLRASLEGIRRRPGAPSTSLEAVAAEDHAAGAARRLEHSFREE